MKGIAGLAVACSMFLAEDFAKAIKLGDGAGHQPRSRAGHAAAHALHHAGRALRRAFVAIQIPHNFSRDIQNGGHATLLCIANAANLLPVSAVTNDGENIAADFSDEIALRREEMLTSQNGQALRHRVAPIRNELRVLYNPTQGYQYFYLLGLLVAALQQGIFFATGASVTSEREHPGDRLPMGKLLLGKAVFYWLLGMASFSLLLLAVVQGIGIAMKSPLWQMLGLGGIYVLSVVCLGLGFATFFRTEESFVRVSIMYPLFGFILSGFTWPLMAMPPALQTMAKLLPQTWFANMFRELFLAGHSPQAADGAMAMLATSLAWLAIGCFRMRRRGWVSG